MNNVDYVIASEIFYLQESHKQLIQTLKQLALNARKIEFIFAYKYRGLGEEALILKLKASGFEVFYVKRQFLHEEFRDNLEYQILTMKYKR